MLLKTQCSVRFPLRCFSAAQLIRFQFISLLFVFGISISNPSLAFAEIEPTTAVEGVSGVVQDSNLQNCIEQIAAARNWTRVEQITGRVDCSKRRISDLRGIEALHNITSLDISVNYVSDLTPLSKLHNLRALKLSFNTVSDLWPLAELTHLQILNVANNMVSDITPLAELRQLTNLNLQNNLIADANPLQILTALAHLNLAVNLISDLTPLANLSRLNYLSLLQNNVVEISALQHLTELQGLNLGGNNIENIEPLAKLTRLNNLNLGDNNSANGVMAGLHVLPSLPQLQHVNLTGNRFVSCTELTTLITALNAVGKLIEPATVQNLADCSNP